jgi:hypothetical protein
METNGRVKYSSMTSVLDGDAQLHAPGHFTSGEITPSTSRKVAGSNPDEVIGFFNWPNPSNRTMSLGSTQPLTEMNTWNIPGGKGRPPRKADYLTVIYEPTV